MYIITKFQWNKKKVKIVKITPQLLISINSLTYKFYNCKKDISNYQNHSGKAQSSNF